MRRKWQGCIKKSQERSRQQAVRGNGIGLKNVQDRIKMNFGEEYGIEIASKLGCYTKIMVRIPLKAEERGI